MVKSGAKLVRAHFEVEALHFPVEAGVGQPATGPHDQQDRGGKVKIELGLGRDAGRRVVGHAAQLVGRGCRHAGQHAEQPEDRLEGARGTRVLALRTRSADCQDAIAHVQGQTRRAERCGLAVA